jgi:hypothetical protein
MMIQMLLRQSQKGFPEDARALARMTLHTLRHDIALQLNKKEDVDAFKQAHLLEVAAQIESSLNASVTTNVGK